MLKMASVMLFTAILIAGAAFIPTWIVKGFVSIRSWLTCRRAWSIDPETQEKGIKEVFFLFVFVVELEAIVLGLVLVGLPFLLLCIPNSPDIIKVIVFLWAVGAVCWLIFAMKKTCERADLKGMKAAFEKAIANQDEARFHMFLAGLERVGKEEMLHTAFEFAVRYKTDEASTFLHEHSQLGEVDNQIDIPEFKGNAEEEGVDTLKSLLNLSLRHTFWQWFALALQQDLKYEQEDWKGHGNLNRLIVKAYIKQAQLVRDYPHVYCLKDYAWAVRSKRWPWKFVSGPISNEYQQVIGGVKMVVGTIGPAQKEELKEGILSLPIWDTSDKKAIPIVLDAIEIHSGGDFNYDWAVSASIEALRNKFPQRSTGYKIHIAQSVELSANTHALLKEVSTPMKTNKP